MTLLDLNLLCSRSLPGINSIPPKVHWTEVHVEEFLARKQTLGYTNHGCGFWSEQQFESCHADFKSALRGRDVGIDHKRKGEVLLDVILDYNAKHI